MSFLFLSACQHIDKNAENFFQICGHFAVIFDKILRWPDCRSYFHGIWSRPQNCRWTVDERVEWKVLSNTDTEPKFILIALLQRKFSTRQPICMRTYMISMLCIWHGIRKQHSDKLQEGRESFRVPLFDCFCCAPVLKAKKWAVHLKTNQHQKYWFVSEPNQNQPTREPFNRMTTLILWRKQCILLPSHKCLGGAPALLISVTWRRCLTVSWHVFEVRQFKVPPGSFFCFYYVAWRAANARKFSFPVFFGLEYAKLVFARLSYFEERSGANLPLLTKGSKGTSANGDCHFVTFFCNRKQNAHLRHHFENKLGDCPPWISATRLFPNM